MPRLDGKPSIYGYMIDRKCLLIFLGNPPSELLKDSHTLQTER